MASEVATNTKKESFWDIDGYKNVIKRTENGKKMCNFLIKLIEERAHIEKTYSEKLNSWYKKWTHEVDKSPEYGSNKEMLKNFVTEADKLSDVHITIKDSLTNLVNSKIKNWRDTNYGVQLCKSKPASRFEKHFKKAQKPWANQVKKVDKLLQTYEKHCKQCDTLLDQEANVNKNDTQAYQRAKDRCDLVTRQMDQAKEQYQVAVTELEEMKPAYTADMNNAFEEAQDFEKRRLEFIKEILLKLQEKINPYKDQRVQEIYGACQQYISSSNPDSDIKMWSEQHGPASNAVLHLFKEFNPTILEKIEVKKQQLAAPPPVIETRPTVVPTVTEPEVPAVVATVVNGASDKNPSPVYSSIQHEAKIESTNNNDNNNNNNMDAESDFDMESIDYHQQPQSVVNHSAIVGNDVTALAVTGNAISKSKKMDERDGEYGGVYSTLNDNHIYTNEGQEMDEVEKGERVKALYDFQGEDADELNFATGDIFRRIKPKDINGWSTGMKDGKSGLFPDSYVEAC